MAKRVRAKPVRTEKKTRRKERHPAPTVTTAPAPPPTPKFAPPAEAPDAQGVALFGQALTAFHRRRYDVAADQFRSLLTRFPGERALADRTRIYLELAERELNRRPTAPRTIEERLTAATAALNNDADAEAEKLVRSVLADDPRHDLALYLMAALEARRGDQDAALSFLARAIATSPEVRAQARHDADFEPLRQSEAFHQLVDPPSSQGGARRPRRHR